MDAKTFSAVLAFVPPQSVYCRDHFLINGQKVWTSYADHADWIFCLVRTDAPKKHEGISFIVFDMASDGVEARPQNMLLMR